MSVHILYTDVCKEEMSIHTHILCPLYITITDHRDDMAASTKLNEFVLQRILEQISNPRISLNLASVVRPEIMLLTDSLKMEDLCWEQRLRTGQFLRKEGRGWGQSGTIGYSTIQLTVARSYYWFSSEAVLQSSFSPEPCCYQCCYYAMSQDFTIHYQPTRS